MFAISDNFTFPLWYLDFLSPPFTIYQASILYGEKAAEGMKWVWMVWVMLMGYVGYGLFIFIL